MKFTEVSDEVMKTRKIATQSYNIATNIVNSNFAVEDYVLVRTK